MIEDLQTIYKGKATIIKNKQYLSTKGYIEPFIKRFENITDKFICNVKPADQFSLDETDIDVIYNKVLITAILPEKYSFTINKITYTRVVCMSYNLDVKTPTCKFYTGVCDPENNFYAFGSNCISIQKLEPEEAINYTFVKTVIDNGLKDQCQNMLTQLQNIYLKKEQMLLTLGQWIDFTIKQEYINDSGKIKLSANNAIEAYKNLTINKESSYYSDLESTSILTVFKAWAEQIKTDEKDLNNRYEKTQLVNQMLKL